MRRVNPWVLIPVVLATLAGGVVGALVTQVSCAPGSCLPAAIGVGVLSAIAAFVGVGIVVVLAVRSLAEWKQSDGAGKPAPNHEDPGIPTC